MDDVEMRSLESRLLKNIMVHPTIGPVIPSIFIKGFCYDRWETFSKSSKKWCIKVTWEGARNRVLLKGKETWRGWWIHNRIHGFSCKLWRVCDKTEKTRISVEKSPNPLCYPHPHDFFIVTLIPTTSSSLSSYG